MKCAKQLHRRHKTKLDLEREIDSIETERDALIAQIDLIDDEDLTKLLQLRYRQEALWEDIMDEMKYSRSWIFDLHKKAVAALDTVLKDRTKTD